MRSSKEYFPNYEFLFSAIKTSNYQCNNSKTTKSTNVRTKKFLIKKKKKERLIVLGENQSIIEQVCKTKTLYRIIITYLSSTEENPTMDRLVQYIKRKKESYLEQIGC